MNVTNSLDFGFMNVIEFSATDWLMRRTGMLYRIEEVGIFFAIKFESRIGYTLTNKFASSNTLLLRIA
jgi:hypothetical protein